MCSRRDTLCRVCVTCVSSVKWSCGCGGSCADLIAAERTHSVRLIVYAWCVVVRRVATSSPAEDRCISQYERAYIEQAIASEADEVPMVAITKPLLHNRPMSNDGGFDGDHVKSMVAESSGSDDEAIMVRGVDRDRKSKETVDVKTPSEPAMPIPWLAILTSMPVWAVVAGSVANAFSFYMLLSCLPTYLVRALSVLRMRWSATVWWWPSTAVDCVCDSVVVHCSCHMLAIMACVFRAA